MLRSEDDEEDDKEDDEEDDEEDDKEDDEDDEDDEDFGPMSSDEEDGEYDGKILNYPIPRNKNPYNYLKTMVLNIFQTLTYSEYYIDKPTIEKDTYIFRIKQKSDKTSVSYVVIHVMTDELTTLPTRSSRSEEVKLLKISSVATNKEHSGKNLAILLLIYAISHLKSLDQYKTIKYSILDDCSDRGYCIPDNIYHQLGFVPRDHVRLTELEDTPTITDTSSIGESTELVLSGPEKVAKLVEFPQRANAKINNIIEKRKITITTSSRKRTSPRKQDPSDAVRHYGGKKSYKRKSYKRKSYKRKSYKRKSYKRKSYKRK